MWLKKFRMPFRIQLHSVIYITCCQICIWFLAFVVLKFIFWCIPGQDYDEDELEQELEALEQEELDKDLLGVGTSTNELPEVPSGDLKEPATTPKEKEKKKGNSQTLPLLCIIRQIHSICFYYLFHIRSCS